jgi:hypothetical protein
MPLLLVCVVPLLLVCMVWCGKVWCGVKKCFIGSDETTLTKMNKMELN